MSMYTMTFYCNRNSDGLIHVQNAVAGMMGQHHVHDDADFERWKQGNPEVQIGPVSEEDIVWLEGDCDCELRSGEMESGR